MRVPQSRHGQLRSTRKLRNAAVAEVKSTILATSLPNSVNYIAGRRLPYKRPFFTVPLRPHEIEQDLALMTNLRRRRNTRGGQQFGTASAKDMSACTITGQAVQPPCFQVPPDAVDSYRKLVKTPLDLSSIQARLSCGEYTHPVIFADDVRSVFRNAALCARADSDLQRTAMELWSIFEEDVALYQIAAVEPVVVPGSSVMGVDKAEVADAGHCQPLKALTDVCKYEEEKSKTMSLHTPVTPAQIFKAVYLPVADGLILATGRPRSRSNPRRRCMSLKQGQFCRHSAYSPSHGLASSSKAHTPESRGGACTDNSRRSHPSTPADTCRIHSPQAGCARVRVHTVCQPLHGPVGDLTGSVCKAGSSIDDCDFDRTSCARTTIMYSHSMREVGVSSREIPKAIFVQTTSLLAAPSPVPSIAESPILGCPSQQQEPADSAEIKAKHSAGCCGAGGMAQVRNDGRPDQAGAPRVGGKSSMRRMFQRVTYNLGSSCEPLKNGGQGPILLKALSKALDMAPMQKAEQPLRAYLKRSQQRVASLKCFAGPQRLHNWPRHRGKAWMATSSDLGKWWGSRLEIQVKPGQQQVDGGDGDVAESDASFGEISHLVILHIYCSHLGGVIEEAVKEPLNGRLK
eukprot:SM000001S04697  [mRNA]  locus=s1:1731761:1740358:- [translate_table: standard]